MVQRPAALTLHRLRAHKFAAADADVDAGVDEDTSSLSSSSSGRWCRHIDAASGSDYYLHSLTEESRCVLLALTLPAPSAPPPSSLLSLISFSLVYEKGLFQFWFDPFFLSV